MNSQISQRNLEENDDSFSNYESDLGIFYQEIYERSSQIGYHMAIFVENEEQSPFVSP